MTLLKSRGLNTSVPTQTFNPDYERVVQNYYMRHLTREDSDTAPPFKASIISQHREEDSHIPSLDSADLVSSSRPIEEEEMDDPDWHYQNSQGVLGPSIPRSRPASLASIREENSQTSSPNSADLVSSSRQIEEEVIRGEEGQCPGMASALQELQLQDLVQFRCLPFPTTSSLAAVHVLCLHWVSSAGE